MGSAITAHHLLARILFLKSLCTGLKGDSIDHGNMAVWLNLWNMQVFMQILLWLNLTVASHCCSDQWSLNRKYFHWPTFSYQQIAAMLCWSLQYNVDRMCKKKTKPIWFVRLYLYYYSEERVTLSKATKSHQQLSNYGNEATPAVK